MAEKDAAEERRTVLSYATQIPWDSYVGAGKAKSGEAIFLEAIDVRTIRRFASESASAMTELLATEEEARRYPQALLKVLMNITDIRVLQYTLTLIEDFVSADPAGRASFFVKPTTGAPAPIGSKIFFLPLLQMVGTGGSGAIISSLDANTYVLERAAATLSQLLSVDSSDKHVVGSFLAWIIANLKGLTGASPKQVKVTGVAVSALKGLLRNDTLREFFVDEHGISRLLPLLAARNTQLLYDVVFCLWSLSLRNKYTKHMETSGAVGAVSRLARSSMPLKLLRVALGMLANVVRAADNADALADIAETAVPATVDALLAQDPKITDIELVEDLLLLQEALRSNKRKLTSLERYEKDLLAKKFEWTVVHSPEFWKEHALKFEADGFKLIASLRDLLKDPEVTPETLAVALADLGEFAIQHPQGRSVLQAMNVRPLVMALLKHEDEEVRQQALLSCSKLLVTRWEFVQGGPSASPHADTPKK